MGLGVPGRRVRDPVPVQPRPAPCGRPRRRCCPRRCAATPPTSPSCAGWDKAALDAYRVDTREHDQVEELRLAYVAFTRAAHRLEVSSYLWSPRATPLRPVGLPAARRRPGRASSSSRSSGCDKPEKGDANPYAVTDVATPWPVAGVGREAELRRQAAELVRAAAARRTRRGARPGGDRAGRGVGRRARAAARRGAGGPRRASSRCRCPRSLSATAVARLRDDPDRFARELARPMPRQPSPAARFGTRFHAWVEARFGQQSLLDPDDLPGRGDLGIDDEDDLRALIARFESGPFGERVPARGRGAVRARAGRPGRARAHRRGVRRAGRRAGWSIDWKTNRRQTADPLQLALYRLAWAELRGVPLDRVTAGVPLRAQRRDGASAGPAGPRSAGGIAGSTQSGVDHLRPPLRAI